MNLRWSILHFFIYIVQICWNLDTQCTGFHANLHYPFIFHFPFSIFHYLISHQNACFAAFVCKRRKILCGEKKFIEK